MLSATAPKYLNGRRGCQKAPPVGRGASLTGASEIDLHSPTKGTTIFRLECPSRSPLRRQARWRYSMPYRDFDADRCEAGIGVLNAYAKHP
jgi:hypothetical protein